MSLVRVACFVVLIWPVMAWSALPVNSRIVAFQGTEGLSEPYRFEVEISGHPVKSLQSLLDKPASFPLPGGQQIAGVVGEARALGLQGRNMLYRLVIEPRLAELAQTRRYRSFMEKNSAEVIAEILDEIGQSHDMRISQDLDTHTLLTQYNETDLNFIHRLMEHAGLYYYFEHGTNSHTMVVTDRSSDAPEIGNTLAIGDKLASFEYGFQKHVGTVQRNNTNFQTPAASLAAQAQSKRFRQMVNEEVRARHVSQAQGQRVANQQLHAHTAVAATTHGASSTGLVSGYVVDVTRHHQAGANQQYLLAAVTHTLDKEGYRNTFSAIPASLPYRLLIKTPTPRASVARAVVSGATGEEIDVDEYGRVRVSFIWSRPGIEPRVRVLQPDAASQWLPRVGEEVLVPTS